jgi:ATP synthase protein I
MSPEDPDDLRRRDQASAWDAFGLLASGVAVWGGVGWLVSEWLNSTVYLILGLLVGMGAALYLIWVRYGKP